jgi:hypothetical protein
VLADERGVELFHLHDGQPLTWYALPPSAEQLMRCIRADHLADAAETAKAAVHVVGRCEGLLEALGHEAGLRVDAQEDIPPALPAAQAAAAAIAGDPTGWVDLRRDELAAPDPWRRVGRLVSSAIVMALLLPLLLAAASYWRGVRYTASAEEARRQADIVYRQLNHLPDNAPILFDVRKRLETDLRRLAGVSGAAGQLPHQPNALETVRRAVSGLPRGMRLRVVELRVSPAEIYLEGQAKSHGDAELIRANLGNAGLNMDLPQTERLAGGGVSFTRHRPNVDADAASGKPDRLPLVQGTLTNNVNDPDTAASVAKAVARNSPALLATNGAKDCSHRWSEAALGVAEPVGAGLLFSLLAPEGGGGRGGLHAPLV